MKNGESQSSGKYRKFSGSGHELIHWVICTKIIASNLVSKFRKYFYSPWFFSVGRFCETPRKSTTCEEFVQWPNKQVFIAIQSSRDLRKHLLYDKIHCSLRSFAIDHYRIAICLMSDSLMLSMRQMRWKWSKLNSSKCVARCHREGRQVAWLIDFLLQKCVGLTLIKHIARLFV